MHKSPGMVSGGIPPIWIFCLWMVGCRSSEGWWKAECATKTTVFRWSGLCLVMAWTSWWIWSTYTCQSMWKRMWLAVCRERATKNYIQHGRFPFNENSGLKFRTFHMPNGTIHCSCTDSTQATARLVIILLSRLQKSGTGDNNFVKWKGTFRSDRTKSSVTGQRGPSSKLVPSIPVGPNRNGPFLVMHQPKFPKFSGILGFNGKHPMSPLLTNLRPPEHISPQPRSQRSPTWNQLRGPAVVGLTVLEYATDLWVSLFAKPPVKFINSSFSG